MIAKFIVFRSLFVCVLACCYVANVAGQLTSNTKHQVATLYNNAKGFRDTIFVFHQTTTAKLSLQLSDLPEWTETETEPDTCTFEWYRFDYDNVKFEDFPFFTETDTVATSKDNLEQGGYKVVLTYKNDAAPPDSFVAWLYMNPGFSFSVRKDDNGELQYNYKNCLFTDFRLSPNTVQSSFKYYNSGNFAQSFTFENTISFYIKPGNKEEIPTYLNTQGNMQYLRLYDPPYEDTQYYFRATDFFKEIEIKDDVMYRSIIPYTTINEPILPKPEESEKSAPVPVKFTLSEQYNVRDYVWRFGNGDSLEYNLENPFDFEKIAPDTVYYTYYTPNTQGYQITLKVTSYNECTYTTDAVTVIVDDPLLDVANVFTPNGDYLNDYFKPLSISLRGFEIWIFTRTGKQVYYYKGDDLRTWEGWDGKIQNSGKEAAEGLYFYSIRAYGWDNPPTKNPQTGPYKGFFHLYR